MRRVVLGDFWYLNAASFVCSDCVDDDVPKLEMG